MIEMISPHGHMYTWWAEVFPRLQRMTNRTSYQIFICLLKKIQLTEASATSSNTQSLGSKRAEILQVLWETAESQEGCKLCKKKTKTLNSLWLMLHLYWDYWIMQPTCYILGQNIYRNWWNIFRNGKDWHSKVLSYQLNRLQRSTFYTRWYVQQRWA